MREAERQERLGRAEPLRRIRELEAINEQIVRHRDSLAEALLAVAPAFEWLAEHHPKAIREMPHVLYERFTNADAALGAPEDAA